MTPLLIAALSLLGVPAVLSCGYLLAMTLLSAPLPLPPRSSRRLRFDVIVPAHNESAVIERTVASLRRIDWPAERWRLLVIADNCTDSTATLARAAGAQVLERHNAEQRGKGYALAWAFELSRQAGHADAVVVIDADAEVSDNLLEACAARLEQGAQAVQVHYGILNPDDSWRTRLLTIAKAAFHIARSRSRERLALSCGIRGNGWCITHRLLHAVPYRAFSLTEDLEYGISLGLAGHRVHYADEAYSNAEMVAGSGEVTNRQRQRWEDGRFQMIRARTMELLRAGLTQPSRICLDLALDLLVLPLSYVAVNAALLLAAALIAAASGLPGAGVFVAAGLFSVTALVLYVLRGWQLSGTGTQGLLDLARAPFFIAWKLALMLGRRTGSGWVRTERNRGG